MRVLITGANGFLGRAVVKAFRERRHDVRALIRPAARACFADDGVEVVRADLRAATRDDLTAALQDVDALVHLAAVVAGPDAAHYASTVGGTERLLDAMASSKTRRLVLASSFSVYDWSRATGTLTESSPIEQRPYVRGAYAAAKLWQERIATRMAEAHGWRLTILRPGVIWDADHDVSYFLGPAIGPAQVVIAPFRPVPLTHVANCANAFVAAAEADVNGARVFNIVDDDGPRAWSLAANGDARFRVPVPYWAWAAGAAAASFASRCLFGARGKLPSLLMPRRVAVFKPLAYSNRAARTELGWIAADYRTRLRNRMLPATSRPSDAVSRNP